MDHRRWPQVAVASAPQSLANHRNHEIVRPAVASKCCLESNDWIGQFVDCHRSWFPTLEASDSSIASICPNRGWHALVSNGDPAKQMEQNWNDGCWQEAINAQSTSFLRACAGEQAFDCALATFNDMRELLCRPGNGIALDGRYAIDLRFSGVCSDGFL